MQFDSATLAYPLTGSQLSEELDNGGSSGGGGGGHSMMAITFPAEKQKQIQCSSSPREVGWPCPAGSSNFQSQMSKKKVIEPMQADTTKAMDKRAAAFCRNEKRRMDRARLYKRWFQVGC
ncbi:hypothetical protein M5K25_015062 [Dendrobium thyrsiflorum]|uniref:Uncharacterized protein n=1 Tax=Dendrobium thyrsiflorum TaxID=117978 RepID=A0ABD0UQ32_DENTH